MFYEYISEFLCGYTEMILSRRSLMTGLLTLPRVKQTAVKNLITGTPCVSARSLDRWHEKIRTCEVAERVMKETRLFYFELVFEERITRDAVEHFEVVQAMAKDNPVVEKIVLEMQQDAQEKIYLSKCLEI